MHKRRLTSPEYRKRIKYNKLKRLMVLICLIPVEPTLISSKVWHSKRFKLVLSNLEGALTLKALNEVVLSSSKMTTALRA